VNVVGDLGLAGIFVLMVLESACIPVPSEATMLFAGFNVHNGEYSLFAATAAGVLGNLVGSWIAYAVGYYGRVDVIEKHGRKLHIKPEHLAWADRWFQKHGEATVFFTRMLPIIRTFISLPAGVARMPFWRFTVFTLLGCIPWVFMLTFVGMTVLGLSAWRAGFVHWAMVLPVPASVATIALPVGAVQGITQGALLGLFMVLVGVAAWRMTDEEWVTGLRGPLNP